MAKFIILSPVFSTKQEAYNTDTFECFRPLLTGHHADSAGRTRIHFHNGREHLDVQEEFETVFKMVNEGA